MNFLFVELLMLMSALKTLLLTKAVTVVLL